MATKIVNSLAGLPAEVTVEKLVHRSNYEELWISFPESERICPHCGSYDCIIKDSGRTTLYTTLQSITGQLICTCSENATTASPATVLSCSIRNGFIRHSTSHSFSTSISVSH